MTVTHAQESSSKNWYRYPVARMSQSLMYIAITHGAGCTW